MRRFALFGAMAACVCAPVVAQDYSKLVAAAKKELVTSFKDPEAARFRGLGVFKDADGSDLYLCGDVNAKNSFGAYTGYAQFFARPGHAAIKDGADDTLFEALRIGACHKRVAAAK